MFINPSYFGTIIAIREVLDMKKSKYRIAATFLTVCAFVLAVAGGFEFGVMYANNDSVENPTASVAEIPTVNTSLSAYSTYSVAGVAEKAADSVVEIVTESVKTGNFMGQYITEGAGSGVIMTVDGYIVTNNHVIEGASKITVTLRNGTHYDATLVGTDKTTDLAVIKIDAEKLSAAKFGNSDSLVVGETAVAIGNPLGQLGGTVTDGIISALDREIEIDGQIMTLLQTNATINPGNSGGGLFNSRAELVGIVNAKSSGSDIEGLGFAIPANTVKPIANDIIEYGYVRGRISTGMDYIDINNSASAWMYRAKYLGVYINNVQSGSNAEKAGLKSGDLVLSVDGKKISSANDIKNVVQQKSIGDTVTYVVLRNETQLSISFALSEYYPG